jgi:aspartyl-tRNA(Asn)/glutamyl-tRNA(Gln) amidotransferase subunit A
LDSSSAAVPVPDYSKTLGENVKGLRIGVPGTPFFEHVLPETEAALRAALALLQKIGAVLVDVNVRNAALASTASAVILGSESSAFHEKRLKEHADLLEPLVRERLEAAKFYSAVDYVKAQRVRTMMKEEMRRVFGECDVLMLPAGNPPPKLEGEIVGTDAPRDPPLPPRPDSFNLANVTGIPSLVLPCGFTAGPPVLPLGIQFCAKPFDEGILFRIGHAYQSATNWHVRKPPMAM